MKSLFSIKKFKNKLHFFFKSVKTQLNSEKNGKKSGTVQREDLENLIKNPIKSLIDSNFQTEPVKDNHDDKKTSQRENVIKPNEDKKDPAKNTQTKTNKKLSLFEPGFKLEDFKNLSKEELKEAIIRQKEQHEFRIKALEKLARLERLQAMKLKKIIQISQDESISSLIYDTLFQNNLDTSIADETMLDLETLEALENEIFNENCLFRSKSSEKIKRFCSNPDKDQKNVKNKDSNELNDTLGDEETTTLLENENNDEINLSCEDNVEVLNLKNTSINGSPPDGVLVIKENKEEVIKNDEVNRRAFFTVYSDDKPEKRLYSTRSEPYVTASYAEKNKAIEKPVSWSYSFRNIDRYGKISIF